MFAAVAAASLTLSLLASAPAGAEVRTGTAPPGRLAPADASTRIAGGVLGYDDAAGKLTATVRLAAPTGLTSTPAIGVGVRVGTWREGTCRAAPGSPIGQLSGLPDTFGYPPYPDPAFLYLTQVKLAALGEDVLDGNLVTAQLTGANVTLTATTPLFAGKSWNCGSFDVADQGDGASERGFPTLDETAPFPLTAPGAGVTATGRALAVRGGRIAVALRNGAAATAGTVTVRAGRTVVAAGRFKAPMLATARASLRVTRAGSALLRRRPKTAVTVVVAARGAKATTKRAMLRR
jgi:hypothetical protein